MKKLFFAILISSSFLTLSFPGARANCLPHYENSIKRLEQKLLLKKKKQKKAELIVFSSVGGLNAAFWGTMFYLVADGSSVLVAVGQGLLFGSLIGGAAVGAVAVPIITYNQIVKANIRNLKWTEKVLRAVEEGNYHQSSPFQSVYRKLVKHDPDLTKEALAQKIQLANDQDQFCVEEKLFRKKQLIRFLKK